MGLGNDLWIIMLAGLGMDMWRMMWTMMTVKIMFLNIQFDNLGDKVRIGGNLDSEVGRYGVNEDF